MNKPISVYTPGVIATIEMFTLAYEELRQYVIYTYYNKQEEPLYVGRSKDFYNAHYFNSQRLAVFNEIEYVGFVFGSSEENLKEVKKYYVRARAPQYNRGKHLNIQGCDIHTDELVVNVREMEKCWGEWLGYNDGEEERLIAKSEEEQEIEEQEVPYFKEETPPTRL